MCPAPRGGIVGCVRLATLVLGILLLTCAPAGAASWNAQQQIAAVGESPDLVSHRTVAAADGRVTQLIEGATVAGQKTAVVTRPPGGTFESLGAWDGGFSSIVDGPDGSVGVISHEWPGNDTAN